MPDERVISLPKSMSLESTLSFGLSLQACSQMKRITIDMKECGWFPPFAMLFISKKLRDFKLQNPSIRIHFKHYEEQKYLAHMGFFQMCGADYGRAVGEAWGSHQYIPITCLRRDDLQETAADRFMIMQDLLQRKVNNISYVLTRDESLSSDIFNVLSYSIREIFRNVFEHGETDEIYYCAQYWPTKGKVEFSIGDSGIGIRRSLAANPNFVFDNDKDAIQLSLLPGVSGKTHIRKPHSDWNNSGYGLYMVNRLARNGGNFVIASGEDAVHLSKKTKNNFKTSVRGTMIRVNFDVNEIGELQSRLEEFRKDATIIAADVKGAVIRPPSAMSLLLRRDFKGFN
ncbi:MAG: ATP-binding protein [Methylobacterium sp.]|nr:ATP-binding protein [Methylobacterium sp.]